MGGVSFRIEGLKELEQKLQALGDKAVPKVIGEGLEAGGAVFRAAVIERAPERVDIPGSKTAIPPGALKRDIELIHGKDEEGLMAVIVQPGKYTNHVARWVEYGHRMIRGGYSRVIKLGRNAGKRRGPGHEIGNVQEHPFIRPAYEASREAATLAAVNALAKGIEREAAKARPGSGNSAALK